MFLIINIIKRLQHANAHKNCQLLTVVFYEAREIQ